MQLPPSFLWDVLATIVGGALLTALFFLVKEHILPLPAVTGRWFFEVRTMETAYNPYKGMVLRYVAMLWREGNRIEGTIEKIYEKSPNGERSFTGDKRTRGVVSGYVDKRYVGKDRILLHAIEDGHGRESTHFYDLTVAGRRMTGTFTSMVADQEGITTWQRGSF